jgi:hypothetical protein
MIEDYSERHLGRRLHLGREIGMAEDFSHTNGITEETRKAECNKFKLNFAVVEWEFWRFRRENLERLQQNIKWLSEQIEREKQNLERMGEELKRLPQERRHVSKRGAESLEEEIDEQGERGRLKRKKMDFPHNA